LQAHSVWPTLREMMFLCVALIMAVVAFPQTGFTGSNAYIITVCEIRQAEPSAFHCYKLILHVSFQGYYYVKSAINHCLLSKHSAQPTTSTNLHTVHFIFAIEEACMNKRHSKKLLYTYVMQSMRTIISNKTFTQNESKLT
jgi:hypothetical protein